MQTRVLGALVVLLLVALFQSFASAQEACPRNPGALAVGASVTCTCTPDVMKSGAVFGSARYSADSSLCRAALHAGAVKDTGGVVTAHVADGCPKFAGSSANGVNSNNWGSATTKTFAFAKPAPECGLASVADALKPGSAAQPAAPLAAAGAAPKPTGNISDACPANVGAVAVGAAQTCTCSSAQASGVGSIYGTARYTPDSSLCRAAVHAGAITAAGGPLVFYVVDGCPNSTGSDSNNLKSAAWSGASAKTVVFAHPTPACGLASIAAAPKPTTLAAAPAAAGPAPALPKDCPRTMNTAGMSPGQSVTCGCTPEAMQFGGSVYGTDLYSGDSLTCVAARHAGRIGDKGGSVQVYVSGGCSKFDGSERNGVTTRAWSSAVPQTFAFAMPVPACAATPAAPKPVAAAPAPSGPPPGSPMAAWLKRARGYGAALPEPLPGWTALKVEVDASDSAMTGRHVSAFRLYRLGKHPAHLDAVSISIANNPDGSARYPIEFWNDPAKAAAEGYKKVKAVGRDALEFTKKGGDTTDLFFLMSNNLFVAVSWQEAHLPRSRMEEYLKVLDFAKIEKLDAK